ncbi:hypothetical protein [Mycoplasmopsis gallinarum]|nr:hypothetical protein [Mycoplasmopsis gallinarum]
MNRLSLLCLIRKKRKDREQKNTNVKFIDLINRDYKGKKIKLLQQM